MYLCLLPLAVCQYSQPGDGLFPGGVGGPQGVDSEDDLVDTIPGLPGEDYPIFSTVTFKDCNLQPQLSDLSLFRSPTPPLIAEDDLTEVTTVTPRLTVKPSTSVLVMELED